MKISLLHTYKEALTRAGDSFYVTERPSIACMCGVAPRPRSGESREYTKDGRYFPMVAKTKKGMADVPRSGIGTQPEQASTDRQIQISVVPPR
jgi:hypothetical protein